MAAQLVSLPEVERLSASVIRILGGNPGKFTLQGTNTYLVGRGRQRLLVDTGEGQPRWIAALKAVLAEERATVSHALVTHWHPDHIGGVADLSKLCPEATVYKNNPEPGAEDIHDGQVFSVEGATLTAVFTPGHAKDHMAFLLDEENSLFTGDNVLGHGTAVFEDLGIYISSLEKMRALGAIKGYPGHGAVIDDCPATITGYIKHRKQREDEVLRVLQYGGLDAPKINTSSEVSQSPVSWTVMGIVKIIYHKVPVSLHRPACHGVEQVLLKLESEGKAAYNSETGRWTLDNMKSTL